MHLKKFLEWIGLKKKLDSSTQKIPHVNEAEVWWVSLGENVGFEINGKSKLFTRPVLVFRKLSKTFYLVIPLTTKPHMGTWYVNYEYQGKAITACLHQVRSVDYRRFSTKLGALDSLNFERIRIGFRKLYH